MSKTRLVAMLLALGTLAVYLPASHYNFTLFDDGEYVYENAPVQNGLTWAGIEWAFTTWHASNWHPVTWLSHMLDCQLFGLNAGPQHVVNVLFHTANAILLLLLLLRLTNSRSDGASVRKTNGFWPSALVAALFAWHPLHMESVAWISERKDVLSIFFALLTLLAYARFVKKEKGNPPSPDSSATEGRKRKMFYVLALTFFALGLMSKPMLVTLPFVMLLLDYWPLQRLDTSNLHRLLIEKIPFFALSAASCVLTFLAQQRGGAVAPLQSLSLPDRLENAPVAIARYLLKIIWPENLAVFYPLSKTSTPALVTALAVLIFISGAVWILRKRRPYFLVGWLWFLGTLVPVIGLVQVGGASMADRYMYLPSVGIFLAAAFGIRDAIERFKIPQTLVAAAGTVILAVCLFLTSRQLNYWRDDIALFSHTVAVTKDNDPALNNLGVALEKAGRNQEALDAFRAALKINPDHVEALNNLANLLDDTGHPEEALQEFQAALQIDPKYPAAHNNLGTLFVELGRFNEAMEQYAEAAKLDPTDWHAPFLMGQALLKQGRDAEAVPFFEQALRNNPDNPRALIFFAQVLASDENPGVRDGQAALHLAQKADELTGGNQIPALDAMAMAEAELGRFADAQKIVGDAITTAQQSGATNDAALLAERLEFYQKNQPFRQSFTNETDGALPKK